MGVILQAFYWNCPDVAGVPGGWWREVLARLPALKQAGFSALWLPPASKAAEIASMGYDPYDYYDLGDLAQKGGQATWFGTGADLRALLAAARADPPVQVYADLVLDHASGADAQEQNPIDGQWRWTRFDPASGRFPRSWADFHPCVFESWDGYPLANGMPDLCHRNPRVYQELLAWARWLIEDVGFDGFRYDMVKGYGAWVVGAIQEYRYRLSGAAYFKPFGVGEYWDSEGSITSWLAEAWESSDNPVAAFDFPLRGRLKALCDTWGYDLRELPAPGALYVDRPAQAVTFVESHDLAEPHPGADPIVNAKMLAYAVILTHEGYPCVFWRDWFDLGLAEEGLRSGIAALVRVHEDHARGPSDVLYVDHDLYLAQRRGLDGQGGLVLVLNNRGDGWSGQRVRTAWPGARLVPEAWRGEDDLGTPADVQADGDGWADLWAPPRGYAVYRPA
ncbi:MAG TPA: alpha-amylase domain-containing protein [Anaeromyxobacter sp.]|nr:alpha-amylase domain-containing protein [Anaeromyxobacter sp.]